MKIAFQTLACPNWDWDTTLQQAAAMGYDGIELRGVEGEMFLPRARPFLPEHIEGTIQQLRQMKLELCCLDTSSAFHDADRYDAAIAEGRAYIDLAGKLGVPYIRVFGDAIPDPAEAAATIRRIAAGLTELGQYAEGTGVTVLLETHGDISNYSVIQEILSLTSSSSIGLLWDFEHPFTHGEDPAVTYRELSPYIKHTHVKDARIDDQGSKQLTLIGEGSVPVSAIVQFMKQGGYDGWLSLEYEKKWFPDNLEEPEVSLPAYIAYMRSLL
ncbi:sugar phosphate isomerase/epimerase family protein [Paenibacillus sp. GCM10023252]|uniref:sugar phosphate isomerase/epimerase family protein n=1 Tax=Paenibacillus sp. GCM10023252 TaxID=3252649 RepID=UPI0036232224